MPTIKIAYAFSQDTFDATIERLPNDFVFTFLKNQFEEGKVNSNKDFIAVLNKELKRRMSLFNKNEVSTITVYNKLVNNNNQHKKLTLPYILVFIEDIFNMVLTSKKKTGLYFIQLALLGNNMVYISLLRYQAHIETYLVN